MVKLPGGLLVTGSADRTIRVWNSNTGDCLRVLDEQAEEICALGASGAEG